MLNNKGFAISSVLYLALILFLLFLMVTLSQFIGASSIISKANEDLVDGTKLRAYQVVDTGNDVCKIDSNGMAKAWYQSDIIVKITSRYGTMYWPRDFISLNSVYDTSGNLNTAAITGVDFFSDKVNTINKKISVEYKKQYLVINPDKEELELYNTKADANDAIEADATMNDMSDEEYEIKEEDYIYIKDTINNDEINFELTNMCGD